MPLSIPTSRSVIDNIQRARKRVAVERARSAPFFAGKLDGVNLERLDDWEEWSKIPILEKEALRALSPAEFLSEFCVAPRSEIAELWRSGGSTGVPLFYPRTYEDMQYAQLSFERAFDCAGMGREGIAHVSFPLGIHPVGQVFARVAQSIGIGVNWAGSGASTPSAAQVQLIDYLKPNLWLGMCSFAIHLANLAQAQGIDLASGSVEHMMSAAEPLSDAKREKIERSWGARMHDGFGMTEAGLMGTESPLHDGLHIWTDMYYIEVLDPDSWLPVEEGEVGTLIVTPLWTNNATPFLRWNSGDLVTYHAEGGVDSEYSVFPLIRHSHRTTGFFKVRGINIGHPEFEDFMFRIAPVNDFKCEAVFDGSLDQLQVSIEVSRNADAEAVTREVREKVKGTFEVTPEVIVLETGALAREFEGAVKAPRFVDRRSE
tara:strand:- start:266 stop:1555 length:1290 start_codon:yes stop_codon:yes gene_type:complete